MFDFFGKHLMTKLVAGFLLVALAPLGIVGYFSFRSAQEALQRAALDDLSAARDRGRIQVEEHLRQTLGDMRYLARNPAVQSSFKSLSAFLDYALYLEHAKTNPNSPVDVKSDEFVTTISDIDPMFKRFLEDFESERGYQDILLIVGNDLGLVLYSSKKLSDLGTSLKLGPLKDSNLGRLWETVIRTRKPAIVDFARYSPANSVNAFLGVPVFRTENELYGVLAVRFTPNKIDEIVAANSKKGATADSFIVGRDLALRTNSRSQGSGILETRIDTAATQAGIQGKVNVGEVPGSTGDLVLNAWGPVDLKGLGADFDWAMVTKIDSSEAFQAVRSLGIRIIFMAAVLGALVGGLAFLLAKTIARPIKDIASKAALISEGDLTVEVPQLSRKDELGVLAAAFGQMAYGLRQQIKQVLDGVNVLAASAAQISSTVTEVAAATSKATAAVSETTVTVEQVKQAAKVSNEKAKKVAESSKDAVDASVTGRKATNDTLTRMNMIKEQMASIGDTVVKLSEHSRAIEEIIDAVQDIADQSNLLAVNASIEAARAGEQGKGFAVVASEIKTLADQSKQATEQVRAILSETRNWVSAVVMATEQGGKAVDAGVFQSEAAGQSIQLLAQSVASSSQAASVIGTSSEQQFLGVDQVSVAMSNIEQAMSQSLEGMRQLESATQKLDLLGRSLKTLVENYKV